MAKRAELRTHLHVGELALCTGYRLRSESLYSIIVHCPILPQTPHHQDLPSAG